MFIGIVARDDKEPRPVRRGRKVSGLDVFIYALFLGEQLVEIIL